MAPSRSVPECDCNDVIDLVSSSSENEDDETNVSAAAVAVPTRGKRSREDNGSSNNPSNNRASKKGNSGLSSLNDSHPTREAHWTPRQNSLLSTCMPFINADVPDDAKVTDSIMPLLHKLNRLPGVLTVTGRNPSIPTQASLLHFQQSDKWSCGFRNTQMMLTALLPQLQTHHAFYPTVPVSLRPYPIQDNRPIPIPSLHQLQTFLQDSWKSGFDAKGALHYQRNIVGKRTEIGAIEASTILTYLCIDTAVVQFIKCHESRRLLGPWIYNYFSKGPCFVCASTAATAAAANNNKMSSCRVWAERLLDTVSTTFASDSTQRRKSCSCPVLPLYLQWNGHSVTVVGVDKADSTGGGIDLLVFDPLKSGSKLKQALSLSNGKNVPALMRLSCQSLLRQKVDCQLLMCSPRPLTERERLAIRDCSSVNVATAACDAVRRAF